VLGQLGFTVQEKRRPQVNLVVMKEVLLELQLAGTVSATRSRGPDPSGLALTTYFRAPFYPRMGTAISP